MNWEEYFNELKETGLPTTLVRYVLDHHKERISVSFELLEKYCDINSDWKILELGSTFPFFIYPLYKEYNCKVLLSDRIIRKDEYGIPYKKINLCIDPIEDKWDLIICQEVIEHLPCNLYKVRDKIINALKINRYFIITIFLGKRRYYKLEEDIPNEFDKSHNHIKEFTSKEEVLNFFNIPEIKLIEHKLVKAWDHSYLVLGKKIEELK